MYVPRRAIFKQGDGLQDLLGSKLSWCGYKVRLSSNLLQMAWSIPSPGNVYFVFCQGWGGTWFQALCFGCKRECYCQVEKVTCHISTTKCISWPGFTCRRWHVQMILWAWKRRNSTATPDLTSKPHPNPIYALDPSGIQKSKLNESQLLNWYSQFLHVLKLF